MSHRLWPFAEQLDDWKSDLLRRLVEHAELSENDFLEVEANLEAHVRGAPIVHGRRLVEADLPAEAVVEGSPRLLALRDIQSAGKLDASSNLTFAPNGLTVVFGDNGTGKSSYSRLLKQSCRAADGGDVVHPNVFLPSTLEPRSFVLDTASPTGRESIVRGVDQPPDPRLGSVSIFDAACAGLYVSKSLCLPFVPLSIQVLERLAHSLGELQKNVHTHRKRLQHQRPRFEELPAGSEARRTMDSEGLRVSDVERLARLDAGDAARLAELEQLQRHAGSEEVRRRALENSLTKLGQLRESIDRLSSATSHESVARWCALVAQRDELEVAVGAFGAELETMPLNGVGSRPWRALWRSAQAFLAEVTETGGEPAHCALCQRELDPQSEERMRTFARIASSTLEAERASVEREAAEARSQLEGAMQRAAVLATTVSDAHAMSEVEPYGEVASFARAIVERVTATLDGRDPMEVSSEQAIASVDRAHDRLRSELDGLSALEDGARRAQLEQERDELLARKLLHGRSTDAKDAAENAEACVRLDAMVSELATKKLSDLIRRLTNELMTERLQEELAAARDDLRIRYLPVDLKASAPKGQPQLKLSLPSTKARIAEVFSTGEQRTIGLAYFLAEVAASDHDGTIVLDDPVSSLDASRRRVVAARLAREAKRRQVVVFTHDPGFFALLERERRRAGVPMAVRTLENPPGSAARVSDESPWVTAPASRLARRLREGYMHRLRKAHREGHADTYQSEVDSFYKRLREAWERLVVEALGCVILPGTFEVHTRCLGRVCLDDHLVELVEDAMGELSFESHDQGPLMSKVSPSIEDLERHLEALDAALIHLGRGDRAAE